MVDAFQLLSRFLVPRRHSSFATIRSPTFIGDQGADKLDRIERPPYPTPLVDRYCFGNISNAFLSLTTGVMVASHISDHGLTCLIARVGSSVSINTIPLPDVRS